MGRAGRDGREAFCYLFLDDADYTRARSLAASAAVEQVQVAGLLERLFAPCAALGVGEGERAATCHLLANVHKRKRNFGFRFRLGLCMCVFRLFPPCAALR